ncbi:class I SAM-dependent methyltransferase [Leptospira interrogans]|uniref:class I SAM-dependent methyltransferase n=1 Tax=Leptospira interrogans TaxID=173 RepID=UPI000297EC84|nr:class I SAM-dependent methyltransferase [Leptospira interrogans]AJR14060.1 SAM-dependent methyltransferase [Leptospira interrogans serovar Linhai str. 56609]EKR28300.1 methyltransferase domain protein [Leptospira interrogans serovar Bataviae str. L1111]EKR36522.1 methyltransferase domain protein [Leptospira interrogans serovar Hebdomadis str. R499]EKR83485.1 methyltransferase domain protein [Leptospira interrogans str. UI 08452]EMN35515.1 methyltransferase domain protein [Leptospira interro
MNPSEFSSRSAWNFHYTKTKSRLSYPDENLVRMLSKIDSNKQEEKKALDFGTGSGRHCVLLNEFGYQVYATDYTENSIKTVQEMFPFVKTSLGGAPPFPFKENFFDVIVSWGVLHYNSVRSARDILKEKMRILKKGGYLAGSVRAVGDTHLQVQETVVGTADLKGAYTRFYTLEELKEDLKGFSHIDFGYTERTPLGKLEERICHWIFLAKL